VTRTLAVYLIALLVRAGSIVEDPYRGITHITRVESHPRPFTMHVLRIDLGDPAVRFRVSPPRGTREATRQTTLDFMIQENAQAAVNAHFFVPFPSSDADVWVVGPAASNGRVYSDFEKPEQSYAIVADAPGLNIDRDNRASIVRRGDRTPLYNTVAGSAQIVTRGRTTIPSYGAELTSGGPRQYSESNSWYDVPNARTAIGLSRDRRTLFLVTVDRAAGSAGLTVHELADLLIRDYGVHDALNLDGGGSTTLGMRHPGSGEARLVNAPADGKPRAVGSSLAVFATAKTTR
jgi:exopolysaccharide biosynthesis protein